MPQTIQLQSAPFTVSRKIVALTLPALLLIGVAGCRESTPQANGQVIAKVGGNDITIHELQNEYRHLNITNDKLTDDIKKSVLSELLKRKYLAQRAQAAGLDREPAILLDMIRSREQALATALVQRDIQVKLAAIGKADVDKYINSNLQRFSGRVRFNIEQLAVRSSATNNDFVEAIKNANNLDTIEREAVAKGMVYSRGIGVIHNDEVPPELLARVKAQSETDVFLMRNNNDTIFFRVKNEEPAPVRGEEAAQRAQGLLRREAIQAELGKKVSSGESAIVYFGDFIKLMEEPAGKGS